MQRQATAVWSGGLKTGQGSLSVHSGVLKDTPYSFHDRFEEGPGTTPEELIAAAHAGCFTMAFSGALEAVGMLAEQIHTVCTITMVPVDGKPTVSESHLEMTAKIPNADPVKFQEAAANAKVGCPISRLLNTTITLDAKLV